MRSRRPTALVAAMVLAATGLAACGDDDEDTALPTAARAAQPETTGARARRRDGRGRR